MANKFKVNPFTSNLDRVLNREELQSLLPDLLTWKEPVDTYNNLPISGNTENDARFVTDTDKLYVWSISTSTGSLNDWIEIGGTAGAIWGQVTGTLANQTDLQNVLDEKLNIVDVPTASAITDTVNKAHTQNTDDYLDFGGINEVSAYELKQILNNTTEYLFDTLYGNDDLWCLSSFDGIDGQTTFTDTAPKPNAQSNNIGIIFEGTASLTDDDSKFGTTSLDCDSNTSNRVKLGPIEHWYDNTVGTFTCDFWIKLKGSLGGTFIFTDDTLTNGRLTITLASDYATINCGGTGEVNGGANYLNVSGFSINDGNWHHIAIIRTANGYPIKTAMYVDGIFIGSTNAYITSSHGNRLYIGYSINAYVNDFRINGNDTFNVYQDNNWITSFNKPNIPADANLSVLETTDQIVSVNNQGNLNRELEVSTIENTINKTHTQGTDQYLDQGGINEVTAVNVKDAVTKKHTQNTDTSLDTGGANEISASNLVKSAIEFMIDGGGSEISTGLAGWIKVPFKCTIQSVELSADQTGSIVVDIWKDTYANYPPTDADSITASAVPTISSAIKSQNSTLTGWTTTINEGDYIYFNVDSVTTIEKCLVALIVKKVN